MASRVCSLTPEGIRAFQSWITAGANGPLPRIFLNDPTVAVPLPREINIADRIFESRYEFGQYLCQLFTGLDPRAISYDRGLWTWLAAFFIDQLCATSPDGKRKVRAEYAYVLS